MSGKWLSSKFEKKKIRKISFFCRKKVCQIDLPSIGASSIDLFFRSQTVEIAAAEV